MCNPTVIRGGERHDLECLVLDLVPDSVETENGALEIIAIAPKHEPVSVCLCKYGAELLHAKIGLLIAQMAE